MKPSNRLALFLLSFFIAMMPSIAQAQDPVILRPSQIQQGPPFTGLPALQLIQESSGSDPVLLITPGSGTGPGISTGSIRINVGATTGYVLTATDGGGDSMWAPPGGGGGGVSVVAPFGSAPNASGGTITGSMLTLEPASDSFPGGITTGTQNFGGLKTFDGGLNSTAGSSITGGLLADSLTVSGNSSLQSLTVASVNGIPMISAPQTFFIGINEGNTTTGAIGNFGLGWGGLTQIFSGTQNVAVGLDVLSSETSGSQNIGIGGFALTSQVSSSDNTALGFDALTGLVTGNNNTGIGNSALINLETGSFNSSLGALSGGETSLSGTNRTALGAYSVVDEDNALVLGSIAGVNSASVSALVGIGTTTPLFPLDVVGEIHTTGAISVGGTTSTATLTVSGGSTLTGETQTPAGIQINTVAGQPTCSTSIRGLFWVIQGASGTADIKQVCLQTEPGDVMAWVSF